MRLEYAAGERMFVDFAGDTVPVTDPETGEIWQRAGLCERAGRQWLPVCGGDAEPGPGVVAGRPRAGTGVLRRVRTRGRARQPEVGRDHGELVRARAQPQLPGVGAHVRAWPFCPPGRIGRRDKAAAEVGVQVAERWMLAPLRKRQFFSLAELNAAIAEQVALVNDRRFRGQAISRRALFEELERDALQPLPATRYEFATWKPARVNIDYHVEFDTRYYSVPYELARQAVEVRATANVVEIFHRGRRVASHVRGYGRQRFFTEPEHMPAAHRAHLEWTPSKLVAWGASIGPPVAELMETILNTRPHPEHGYRACLGLMRLAKRYEPERMVAACQRALQIGSTSYRSVDAILKNGLDKVPPGDRAGGEDRAHPARQPARRGLLPADPDGGLSHAADTRPSTSSMRWGLFGMALGLREQLESNQYLELELRRALRLAGRSRSRSA